MFSDGAASLLGAILDRKEPGMALKGRSFRMVKLYDAVAKARRLIQWWLGELSKLIPDWMGRLTNAPLYVVADKETLVVYDASAMTVERAVPLAKPLEMGAVDSDLRQAQLIINRQHGLVLPLTITDEAEGNLGQVLSFSMDRYTPYAAEEVYFDFKIINRDRVLKKIDVVLYAVPRAFLDGVITRLAIEQIEVEGIDMALDTDSVHGPRAGINLAAKGAKREGGRYAVLNAGLAASAAVLLVVMLLIPVYHRHKEYQSLQAELTELKRQAVRAEEQYREVQARKEYVEKIVQRKELAMPVIEVLRELTELTPDYAWIGQVELKAGRLKLTGEANAGSELIEALSKSQYFVEPRFEAPLTQNPRTDKERFVMSLAVKESR